MKKTILLILSALFALNIFAYDNLYVVGNACSAGWSPTAAIEMTRTSDNVFTWEGELADHTGDNGNRGFKFLTNRGWDDSVTVGDGNSGNVIITSGIEEELRVRVDGNDNRFQVPATGTYRVDVDLNTMKMICTLQAETPETPDLNQLFFVGSATPLDGYGFEKYVAMTKESDGVFVWVGTLKQGDFKFQNKASSWAENINPVNDVNPFAVGEYDLKYKSDDKKFFVSEEGAGEYKIKVDLNNMKMTVSQTTVETVDDLSQLYIDGSAIEGNREAMTKVSEGIFAWYGTMTAADNFRFFLDATGTANVLEPAAQTSIAKNSKLNLLYYSAGSTDNASFTVSETGNYTILVDLNTQIIRFMQLNYNELKIIGSALNEDAAWNGDGIAMHEVADGEFVYVGPLYNRDNNSVDGGDMGKFKFVNFGIANLIACNENSQKQLVELDNQYAMSFQSHANDNKFHVAESGIYTVYVNLKTMSMKFSKVDKSSLYLAGVGSEGDIAMTEDVETAGLFTWTGDLVANQDFYFLNYSGYANSSIVATTAQEQAIELSTAYDLNSDAGATTNYFTVSEDDKYIVSVNLNTMEMKVEKDDNGTTNLNEVSSGQIFSVISNSNSLLIRMNEGKTADRIEVYDATGKSVAYKLNVSGTVSLGENTSKGLYIIKVSFEGAEYSTKTILK